MDTVYLVCAVVGGTLIVCQFLLTVLGLGGHHDVGGHDLGGHDMIGHDMAGHDVGGHDTGTHHAVGHDDAHTNWFVGLLTFRTVVAALAFFGLAGLAAAHSMDPEPTFAVALAAGAGALFVVGLMMKGLGKLNVDGTVRIERSVGSTGTVYLGIPAGKAGPGKVHVSVQNRLLEYQAVTSGETLPIGTKIVVVRIAASDTVEVSPVPSMEMPAHV